MPGAEGGVAPTQLPVPTQMPTISTVNVDTVIGGIRTQVPIVFTQKFAQVPSQGPLPQEGTIGLGTLKKGGKVKRGEGVALFGWSLGW